MSRTSTIARMRRNGTLVGAKPDRSEEPLHISPLAPMSAAEIEASAARDGDNPPLADAPAGKLRRIPRVKTLRRALANTQISVSPPVMMSGSTFLLSSSA